MSKPVRFVPRPLLKLANRASLRAALSTSYLLQMAILIGLTTGLAWRTIDQTGLYLTRQKQESIAQRIGDRLSEDQQHMQEIQRSATDAMTLELWSDEENRDRWLWQHVRAREAIAIGVRDAQGQTSAVLRRSDDTLISISQRSPDQAPAAYGMSDDGQHLDAIPLTELKQLTLYGALFDTSIEATLPISRFQLTDPNAPTTPQQLAVVFPTDALDQLLDRLYLGQHGFVAVLNRDGQPLASSIKRLDRLDPSTTTTEDTATTADPNAFALLEQIVAPLRDQDGTLTAWDTPQQRTLSVNNQRYQVALSPIELSPSRQFWIVSAIMDREFGQIGHRDAIGFVMISALAALLVGGVNLLKVRTTIRAIANLKTAIDALGQQRWNRTPLTQRPPEFRQVNASVMQAAQRLRSSLNELHRRNTKLQEAEQFKTMLFDDSIQRLSPSLQAIIAGEDTDCHTLKKTAKQTLSLLENAAELSQLQAEQLNLNMQSVALGSCLELAIEQHRAELDAQQITLERHNELSTICVSVDPQRLQWVFHELIENAIQFSHRDSTIAITTAIAMSATRSTYHDLPEVSITITDFGMGIDPSEQHKLFQPFARMTNHHPDRCGYGLGLVIAHQTISMMGGRLELSSQGVDCGTTARVVLPVVSPDGASQPFDWNSITDAPFLSK